ncbi:MAG: hypothetical protein ACOX37_06705 [Bacillota bacterium]
MSNKEQSWLEQPLLKGFFSALLISLFLNLCCWRWFSISARLSESHLSSMAPHRINCERLSAGE